VADRHGHRGTGATSPEYQSWRAMWQRVRARQGSDWKSYGARGITVCERWEKFQAFLADMGPRPVGMTIDRIDNSRNYEPENCRWASRRQQVLNRAVPCKLSDEKVAEIRRRLGDGHRQCDLAREFGVRKETIHSIKTNRIYKELTLKSA